MEVTNHIINILALLVVALHGVYGADTNTVSVTNAGDFSVLPACVQSCLFYNSFGVADYLVEVLGCTSTIYNACYCTQIADQSASTALSTCVNSMCRGTTEISNAISLYESYCNAAGYPRTVSASSTSSSATESSSSPAPASTSSTSIPATTTAPSVVPASTPSSSSAPSTTVLSSTVSAFAASSSSESSAASSASESSVSASSASASSAAGSSSGTSSPSASASGKTSSSSKVQASLITGGLISVLAGLLLAGWAFYAW